MGGFKPLVMVTDIAVLLTDNNNNKLMAVMAALQVINTVLTLAH